MEPLEQLAQHLNHDLLDCIAFTPPGIPRWRSGVNNLLPLIGLSILFSMEKVFVYWDNSNIFHEAQRLAEEIENSPEARFRVCINFDNLLRLAHADRPVEKALAAGSVPPEMQQLWNRMESKGVQVHLHNRGSRERGEQDVPDRLLQLSMLEDALDYNGNPGIVVLLTGDGAGYMEGMGFHSTLERMHRRRWRVEILSWAHSTNQRMRRWAEDHGLFIPLDDFYNAITFLEPSRSGFQLAPPRYSVELNLSQRALSPVGPAGGQGS